MSIDIFKKRSQNNPAGMNEAAANGHTAQNAGVPDMLDLDSLTQDNSGIFTDAERAEMAALAEAMTNNDRTYVDDRGTIHLEGEANTENMLAVDGNVFGAPTAEEEEVARLAQAMRDDHGDGYFVDEFGRIRLDGEPGAGVNMTKVDGNIFGAPTAEEEEVARLAQAMREDHGDGYFVDEFGRIRLDGEPGAGVNMTKVDGNIFGAPTAEEEEVARLAQAMREDHGDGYFVDEFGRIRLDGEPGAGVNMTKVDGNIFGAHEDQWYNKNPQLFRAEVATMRKQYPNASYGFLSTNGNMYWVVTIQVFKTPGVTKPWKFMLVYDKDHPHNNGFGGSIKVVPLGPSLDELKTIAGQHGRPGVPHVISNTKHFLTKYLCTRWPKDIESGDDLISSAVQATAWAADWAAHFEVGIRNECVWNKWCNDEHFRWMQVKCRRADCQHKFSCPYGKRG